MKSFRYGAGSEPFDTIKISSERLPQLQKTTEQDPVMQTLNTTILIGWPDRREEVPLQIREYWNYREELILTNGILFKNQQVIIPKALRPELTTRAHSSHQEIEAKTVKQPMQTYEVPDRPWSRVLSHLFNLNCKE